MHTLFKKVAAVALAAAMVSSAFAMSTATAFATAPALPTAKAQLENSTVYMAKGGNTTVNVTKAVTSNLFKELDANSTAANLNIKSVTTTDGAVLDTSDITAIEDTNATATADNTVVKVDNANGNFSFTEQKAGTQQVTVSGLQCTAGGKTYNLAPITFDIDLVDTAKDDGGYISTVWSSAKTDADANIGNTVDSINVGGNAYLYSETVAADDSEKAFATPAYISAVDKTASSDTAVLTVDTNKATGVAVGSATASYLYNNKGVKETKTSPELSVTTAPVITTYDNVSAIEASTTTKGSYDVTYGTDKKSVTMTNDQLAKVTLKLAGTTSIPAGTTSIPAGTTSIPAGTTSIPAGATIGTLDINGNSVTIDGATVKKVTDTKADSTAEVTVTNTLVGTTNHDAAVSTKVDSIDTKGAVHIGNAKDVATTTVGSVKTTSASTVDVSANANKDKTAIRTKVNSITANNIEINSAKASIGVITRASADSQGTLQMNNSSSTEDIILPAVDGYKLTVNSNTTVASIADCPSASIASGKTLTVSGKATFTGNVIATGGDRTGTLAIAPNSLTILGNRKDAFTLKVNDVKNGDTAFMTKDNAKAIAYTNDGNDKKNENKTAYANIVTPGYTAEQKAGSKNAVVRDVTVGSLTDATQGSKLNSNGTYDVEIVSGETKQLAVNPYPASSFGDNFHINWSYTGGKKNADFKLGTVGTSGLTNTITGTYDKNNTTTNKTQVTAQLYKMDETTGIAEPVKGKPVTYNVTVTDKKSVATTDFTLTADKNVIKPSESMTLTAAPNGDSALTDVTAKSSNDFVATVPTSATDNALKVTATGKTGTAVITVTATLPDGSKVSHVYTVSVTNTPVVAIVNGKIVGPTDIVKVTQSTAQHVTFITADGKKFTDFKYTAGNDKVMQTRAYPSKGYTLWDGMSGNYGMYMNGGVKDGVGDKTGVYVNGQLAFTVQVTDRPFQCDTTQTVDLKKGNTYCFKITPKTTVDNFTFNTARDAALTTCGLQKNADGSYLCKVHGTQTGSYGVYITLNGQQYKVFAVNVK
jgi:hypothetical protein